MMLALALAAQRSAPRGSGFRELRAALDRVLDAIEARHGPTCGRADPARRT
jgi:hypothetical protein